MADIFLSYAMEDRETAGKVAHQLEANGWTIWWDRKIPAGMTWRQVIETSLNEMRCMVVLWSTSSISSAWVSEEAEEGRARDKLVPVCIEPVVPPLGFRGIQAADLAGWDGSASAPGFRQLVADLEMRLGRPAHQPSAAGATIPAVAAAPASSRHAVRLAFASTAVAVLLVVAWIWHSSNDDAGTASRTPPENASVTPATPVRPLHHPTVTETPGSTDPAVKPKVSAAAVESTAANKPTRLEKEPVARAVRPARCRDLLERQGLGDPLTAEDRAFLQKECRS